MYVVNTMYDMLYSSEGLTCISMYAQRVLLYKHALDGNKHGTW